MGFALEDKILAYLNKSKAAAGKVWKLLNRFNAESDPVVCIPPNT